MLSRKSFLMCLASILIFPFKAIAQGVKACAPIARLDMFGPLCQPKPPKDTSQRVVKTQSVPASTAFRSYSAVYDIEGDRHASDAKIARHLVQVHGINPSGMSRGQMLMAHDRAHGVRFSTAPPASSCPGGVCPTNVPMKKGRKWK